MNECNLTGSWLTSYRRVADVRVNIVMLRVFAITPSYFKSTSILWKKWIVTNWNTLLNLTDWQPTHTQTDLAQLLLLRPDGRLSGWYEIQYTISGLKSGPVSHFKAYDKDKTCRKYLVKVKCMDNVFKWAKAPEWESIWVNLQRLIECLKLPVLKSLACCWKIDATKQEPFILLILTSAFFSSGSRGFWSLSQQSLDKR